MMVSHGTWGKASSATSPAASPATSPAASLAAASANTMPFALRRQGSSRIRVLVAAAVLFVAAVERLVGVHLGDVGQDVLHERPRVAHELPEVPHAARPQLRCLRSVERRAQPDERAKRTGKGKRW